MIRELFQNALEAALQATGPKLVTLGAVEVDSVRKLRIRNTGPGMDADALHRMCDLASSINKVKGLDRNFGMGAKVASLPSNHHGVRYRSCTAGRIQEVILGKRDGIYGRLLRAPPGRAFRPGAARLVDLADVTEVALAEGDVVDHDWTEVVLLGMAPEQDTVTDPYAGNPIAKPYWLPEALYHRYFDIPSGVRVTIEPDLHWAEGPRPFSPLRQRAITSFTGYAAIPCGGEITIHFLYDAPHPQRPWENASSDGALQRADSLVALVWRNEMYDVLSGSPWLYEAPNFGLTFAGRNISILIQLADDYPVLPDAYRQFLLARIGSQSQLSCKDFTGLVRACRPDWVLGLCENRGGGDLAGLPLTREMSSLAASLKLDQLGGGGGVSGTTDAVGDASAFALLRASCGIEPVLLRDPADIRARWLEERAACFYPETKLLFINMCYSSFVAFAERLAALGSELAPTEEIQAQAESVAEALVVRRMTRAVLFGLSKHLKTENWQPGNIEKAISCEALSIVADDMDDLIAMALSILQQRIGTAGRIAVQLLDTPSAQGSHVPCQ